MQPLAATAAASASVISRAFRTMVIYTPCSRCPILTTYFDVIKLKNLAPQIEDRFCSRGHANAAGRIDQHPYYLRHRLNVFEPLFWPEHKNRCGCAIGRHALRRDDSDRLHTFGRIARTGIKYVMVSFAIHDETSFVIA